jgi:tetratricopeptide (TPR) repeat protein
VEVFQNRQANCLSFTHLFVAMARSLGLDAYFLKVHEVQTFSREGDLVIRAGHITAAAGPPTEPRILEFSEVQGADYKNVTKISDLNAVALFYSNRGAEFLRQGKVEDAVWWLERAVVLDPQEPDAWVNLGVARRWQGNTELAEASYRRALELDSSTAAAYQNLAALYRNQGDEETVKELMALTNRRDNRNPFTYIELGDLSFRQGDLDAAARFYRRALRLDSELAAAHAALGQWAAAAGKQREARKFLEKARRLEPENERVLRLDQTLHNQQAMMPNLNLGRPPI